MSARQKRFSTELKMGKYPSWLFADADHLPIEGDASVDSMGEYIIHLEYPRFISTVDASDEAYNIDAPITAGTPMVKSVSDVGNDAFVVVGWEADGEVASVRYSAFVNLDDGVFDLNAVVECLGEATQYWAIRTADENSIEL